MIANLYLRLSRKITAITAPIATRTIWMISAALGPEEPLPPHPDVHPPLEKDIAALAWDVDAPDLGVRAGVAARLARRDRVHREQQVVLIRRDRVSVRDRRVGRGHRRLPVAKVPLVGVWRRAELLRALRVLEADG